jgi:NAD(P)H-hydrate epimerase
MNEDNAGDIRVRDIGIPADARLRTGPGEFLRAPHRSAASGARSGRVLVVAGGPFTGAPVFAGLAALRSGAERATLVVPSPAAESARAGHPDLVVHTVGHDVFTPADVPRVEEIVRKFPIQSMVIGMGVGREPDTLEAMRTLVGSFRGRIPMVVDADALASLTATPGASSSLVATPNTGEYLRWFGDEGDERPEDRLELARRHALDWGVTLLAKGPADLITDGREGALNLHHHPAATVAGVGDVLGGVVGGLLAQGVPAFGAARLAAYWVGDAGSHVAEARGYGLTASDVLSELPATLVAGLRRLDGYA